MPYVYEATTTYIAVYIVVFLSCVPTRRDPSLFIPGAGVKAGLEYRS